MTAAKFDLIVHVMNNWSEQWQKHILKHGSPLTDEETQDARCVGVAAPDKVRVLTVPNVPMPHYPILHESFIESKVFSLDAHGLTLGHGVFLKSNCSPWQYWLTHELVHVAQYERMGGLLPGLRQYLHECFTDGYLASDLEQEAHQTALKCLAQRGITFASEN